MPNFFPISEIFTSSKYRKKTTNITQSFISKLYTGVLGEQGAPPVYPLTGLAKVGIFGDSIGNSNTQFIFDKLQSDAMSGVHAAGGFYSSINVYSGASKHTDVSSGEYFFNGQWQVCPSGGIVEYLVAGGIVYADTLKIYYIKEPGAGTFKVQLHQGVSWNDESGYTDVDASNASTTCGVITLNKTSGKFGIRLVGLTGTVNFIAAAYLNTIEGGIASFRFDVGGLALDIASQTPTAITQEVFNDLNLDLAFIKYKDNNYLASLQYFFANSYPTELGTKWIFIGCPPDYSESSQLPISNVKLQNQDTQNFAATNPNKYYYFDGYTPLISYENLVALGWNGDGIHLSPAADLFVANILMDEIGLSDLLGLKNSDSVLVKFGKAISFIPNSLGMIFKKLDWASDISIYSDNYELIVKGGRSASFRDINGNCSVAIGLDFNNGQLGAKLLSITPTLSTTPPTSGPCLRPMGGSDSSGIYSSGLNPGDGSLIAPFAASKFFINTTTGAFITSGPGSPEGVVTAPVGSLYTRTDGGALSTLYVKESGSDNTGWVFK